MRNKRPVIAMCMVAAVVVAGAVFFVVYGNLSRNSEDDALVWGGGKNISMLPIIADKKGFFREVGLNVSAQYVQTGKIAMDAVISGLAPPAFRPRSSTDKSPLDPYGSHFATM